MAPLFSYQLDDDSESPASEIAVALGQLTELMNERGSADHADVFLFIRERAHLPSFTQLSNLSRRFWRIMRRMQGNVATIEDGGDVSPELFEALETLASMLQVHATDSQEITEYVSKKTIEHEGFVPLAAEMIRLQSLNQEN